MCFSPVTLSVSLIFKPASDPKMVEENLPPLQSHHLLMYGPAIMVEFGRCDGDCCCSIAQSCLTLCDPMDCSLPGSSIHGIFQARVLEWGAISFSRGSS